MGVVEMSQLKTMPIIFFFQKANCGRQEDPNLQVVITHASHVCSQHSFGLPLIMNGMHGK